MTQVPLGNGFYREPSLPVSAQECTNWYPSYPQSDALSEQILLPTPGLELLTSTTAGQVNRGGIEFGGKPYVVQSNTLYRIDEIISAGGTKSYSAVSLGTIAGAGRVKMAHSNTEICIVVPGSSGTSYIYSVAGGLVTISDTDFDGPANGVCYIDGYFVFTAENKFFCSALNDGTSYDALDFATAEVDPDDIVGCFVHQNQLHIFGTEVTEVYENVGGTGFPFQRIEGFIIDRGLYAAFAVAEVDDTFMFLGGNKGEQAAIWMLQGNKPVKVSTTAIDYIIQQESAGDLAKAFAMSYAQNGAYFAVFSFRDHTFVYDSVATAFAQRPIWHKRESTMGQDRWRVNSIVHAYGRLITGDSFSNSIGAIEPERYQEYSTNMNRTWSSPPMGAGGEPLFMKSMEVTLESGTSTQGDEGFLVAHLSKDGGKTFETLPPASIGKIGEYGKRVDFKRLGRFPRFAMIKLTYSHNSKCVPIRVDIHYDDV